MEVLGEIEKQKTVMENKRENGDLVVLWLEKMLDSGQKLLSVLREVNVKPQEELPNIDKNVTILADGNQMSAKEESKDSYKIQDDCEQNVLDLGNIFVSNETEIENDHTENAAVIPSSETESNFLENMLTSIDWESMVENVIQVPSQVGMSRNYA